MNMLAEAMAYPKKCDRCQRHAVIIRKLPERLISINYPISFAIWEMDIIGPLHMENRQRKFIVVAIDYFSKWVEAKPPAEITTKQITQFSRIM